MDVVETSKKKYYTIGNNHECLRWITEESSKKTHNVLFDRVPCFGT